MLIIQASEIEVPQIDAGLEIAQFDSITQKGIHRYPSHLFQIELGPVMFPAKILANNDVSCYRSGGDINASSQRAEEQTVEIRKFLFGFL